MATGHGRRVNTAKALSMIEGQQVKDYVAALMNEFGIKQRIAKEYVACFKWAGWAKVEKRMISRVKTHQPSGFARNMGNKVTLENVLQRYRERDREELPQSQRRALTDERYIAAFTEGRMGWCPGCRQWCWTRLAVYEKDAIICGQATGRHGHGGPKPLVMHETYVLEADPSYQAVMEPVFTF